MNKDKHPNGEWIRRKDIRLGNHDYSQNGIYFVTVCVKDKHRILWDRRSCIFNMFTDSNTPVFYSDIGTAVNQAIMKIPEIYPAVTVIEYSIMPDHLHLLFQFRNGTDVHGRALRARDTAVFDNG